MHTGWVSGGSLTALDCVTRKKQTNLEPTHELFELYLLGITLYEYDDDLSLYTSTVFITKALYITLT